MSQFMKKAEITFDKLKSDLCKFIEDKLAGAVDSVTNTGVWKIEGVLGVSYRIIDEDRKVDINVVGMTNNSLIIRGDFVVVNKNLTDFSIPELIAIGNWTENYLNGIKLEYMEKVKQLERTKVIQSIVSYENPTMKFES